jgi:dinuclear metal center YbgI/SA1388 family protein
VPELSEVIAALEEWFDPSWAESWDAVGLTCGDPADPVERVLLAVDAVPDTVREAQATGAQLLLTHHPLLLAAVHGVAATDPKGSLVHRMVRAGIAHYVAHTNADVADPGVSDALANRLGLTGLRALAVTAGEAPHTLVVFVPTDDTARLIGALAAVGAGHRADHERSAWTTVGVGTFRAGATIETVAQTRLEMAVPRRALPDAIGVLQQVGDLMFDVYPQVPLPTGRGTGRVGRLPRPVSLRQFADHAAAALPATTWGVRVAGDPERPVRTVAVCGGSGAPYIDAARAAGADAYLTADLKHHAALEAVAERGRDAMALVDAAHWATEAPWLDAVAGRLRDRFGTTVGVTVSATVTDPWILHVPSPESSAPK